MVLSIKQSFIIEKVLIITYTNNIVIVVIVIVIVIVIVNVIVVVIVVFIVTKSIIPVTNNEAYINHQSLFNSYSINDNPAYCSTRNHGNHVLTEPVYDIIIN